MNAVPSFFLNNDVLDTELEAFCNSDPEYQKRQQQFYELFDQLTQRIGYDLSDDFEKIFNAYLFRTADLYYLFGLGFRQELLHTIGAGG